MITQIFTQNNLKILTLFNLSPGSKFNRNEIKEKTQMNNAPLDSALTMLINSRILIKNRNYYSINFESSYSKQVLEICSKQFMELKELPLNVYYILMDIIYFFSKHKNLEIFLFGSYAKLVYTPKSDIDIAILCENAISKQDIDKLIQKLEKTYKKQIEIHYFNKKEFYKNKTDPLVKSILKDGVKLI